MHKNWSEICKIRDSWLRLAVALLDITTESGMTIAQQMPHYFTEESQEGPYPLSMLMEESFRWGREHEPDEPLENHRHDLYYTDVLDRFNVPYEWFDEKPEQISSGGYTSLITPELKEKIHMAGGWGGLVTHEGKNLIVIAELMNNDQPQLSTVALAPAERIYVDIDLAEERQRWKLADLAYEEEQECLDVSTAIQES